MKLRNVWKKYQGSGSYHGTGTCENSDCGKKAKYFLHYTPDTFENKFSVTHGYCTLKCAVCNTNHTLKELKELR